MRRHYLYNNSICTLYTPSFIPSICLYAHAQQRDIPHFSVLCKQRA